MLGMSLGTFFRVQESIFGGQQGAVGMIVYGGTQAIGIFMWY